jgi:hypothetical protein
VPLGNFPLAAITKQTGIGKVRGTIMQAILGQKVLATYPPEMILRNWSQRIVVIADLKKIAKEKEFPEIVIPTRMLLINPTLDEVTNFYNEHLKLAKEISIDIETKFENVRTISFAPSPDIGIVIPLIDTRNKNNSYWKTTEEEIEVLKIISIVLRSSAKKIMQNGSYDLQYNWLKLGIPTYGFGIDTTLVHHALYPELEKNLGFLGSIYTSEPSWKLMRKRADELKKEE